MDHENFQPSPDDQSVDPPQPELTPLSELFPEVTEEEAKLLDGETTRIMERRSRVMALYNRGTSMQSIADQIKCSVGTIHRDIHIVLDGYRRIAIRSASEHIASALQRLMAREIDIEREWEKSKSSFSEMTTGRRTGGTNGGNMASVKKRERYGDPRLMSLLLQIWDRRCKLLGLLSGDDKAAINTGPIIEYIAGIHPRELLPPPNPD